MRYVSNVILRQRIPEAPRRHDGIEIRHLEFFERAVTFPIYPHCLIGPPIVPVTLVYVTVVLTEHTGH